MKMYSFRTIIGPMCESPTYCGHDSCPNLFSHQVSTISILKMSDIPWRGRTRDTFWTNWIA